MKYESVLFVAAGLLPLVVITGLSLTTSFVPFNDYISILGTGDYAALFNASLIVAAILAVPFVISLKKEYNYNMKILFLSAAVALALVGIFPLPSPLHVYASGAFFLLAFATMIAAGLKTRHLGGWVSAALGLIGFSGLTVFQPFVETLLVFAIGIWVIGVGLRAKKVYGKP